MEYEIIVSERSRKMLAEHVHFLAKKSPEAARNTKNDILKAIRSLSQMPERFPFLMTEFITPNKYHKMFVKNWFLVLYQIKDHIVYVDYIIDCRQDYQWLTI